MRLTGEMRVEIPPGFPAGVAPEPQRTLPLPVTATVTPVNHASAALAPGKGTVKVPAPNVDSGRLEVWAVLAAKNDVTLEVV